MVRKATAQEVEILPSSRSGAAALLNQSRIAGWQHIRAEATYVYAEHGARAVIAEGGDLVLGAPGHRVLAWRNGNPRLEGRNLMGTLMVDFITSLDGYGAG